MGLKDFFREADAVRWTSLVFILLSIPLIPYSLYFTFGAASLFYLYPILAIIGFVILSLTKTRENIALRYITLVFLCLVILLSYFSLEAIIGYIGARNLDWFNKFSGSATHNALKVIYSWIYMFFPIIGTGFAAYLKFYLEKRIIN